MNEFTDLLKIIKPIHAQKLVDKRYFNNQHGCHVHKNCSKEQCLQMEEEEFLNPKPYTNKRSAM
jgi:hypothetical protein